VSNSGKPYIGDIGTVIRMTLKEDLTNQDGHQFNVKKPDDSTTVWSTTLTEVVAGEEYILSYTIVSGDFDQAGDYLIQPLVTFTGTPQNYGVTKKIKVHALYE
jgi:hypothetical protein